MSHRHLKRSAYVGVLAAVVFLSLVTALSLLATSPAQQEPKAATAAAAPAYGQLPVMGYNTWYEFDSSIDQSRVLTEAHYMVADGLVRAGYDTLTLDNGWQSPVRTAAGALTWSASEFPNGIPWLAQTLRSEGIALGIYTAIGSETCGSVAPGSYGHYQADAAEFASWGASFVKVDDCGDLPAGTSFSQLTSDFASFGSYIRADGMVYSEELPVLQPVGSANWASAVAASAKFANMWRVAPDESWVNPAQYTIDSELAADTHLHGYAGPGHWNDLDMVVPGTVDAHPFNWTLAQEQSQLSVWAMEASPLFISTNLAKLTGPELGALLNPDVIAIDQSGSQSPFAYYDGTVTGLAKTVADGVTAVLLTNTGGATDKAFFTAAQLSDGHVTHAAMTNVWTGHSTTLTGLSLTLAPGATDLLLLKQI